MFTFVCPIAALDGLFARWVKDFAADKNRHSQKFYRFANEIPTIIMIFIVFWRC
ncbi:MAG: CopD family protein [Xanthobacteraceae bacterium]